MSFVRSEYEVVVSSKDYTASFILKAEEAEAVPITVAALRAAGYDVGVIEYRRETTTIITTTDEELKV